MKRSRSDIDRHIADGLRADRAPEYDGSRLGALAARIERAAAPLLDRRRLGSRDAHWWDIAASWAGTLIPVGVTVAAASIALLWVVRPTVVAPQTASPGLIVGATRPAPQPDLLDLAVEEIVRPPARTGGR